MDSSEKNIRLEYWRSKAKVMQDRIEDLEKQATLLQSSVDGFETQITAMREWAKRTDRVIKELKNGKPK